MSADNQFDEFLRSKLGGHEDGFIGGDWQQLRQKLEARKAEKKRRRRPVYIAFSTMSLIVLMAVLYSISDYTSLTPSAQKPTQYTHEQGSRQDKLADSKSYNPTESNRRNAQEKRGSNAYSEHQPGAQPLEESHSNGRYASPLADNSYRANSQENSSHTSHPGYNAGANGATRSAASPHQVSINLNINRSASHRPARQNNYINHSAQSTNAAAKASLNANETTTTEATSALAYARNKGIMLAQDKDMEIKKLQLKPLTEANNGRRPLVKTKPKLPIEIGLQTVVGMNTMHSKANPSNSGMVNKDYASTEKQSQKPGLNLSANIIVKFPLTSRFNVSSGIGVNKWSVEGKYEYEIYRVPVINNVTHSIVDYVQSDTIGVHASSQKEFTETTIPINTEYTFSLGNKMMVGLKAGSTLHLNQSYSGTDIDPTYLTEKELSDGFDLKKAYISWNFGTAMYMPMGNKMRLCIQPEFSHSIGSVLKPGSMASWQYSSLRLTATALYRF